MHFCHTVLLPPTYSTSVEIPASGSHLFSFLNLSISPQIFVSFTYCYLLTFSISLTMYLKFIPFGVFPSQMDVHHGKADLPMNHNSSGKCTAALPKAMLTFVICVILEGLQLLKTSAGLWGIKAWNVTLVEMHWHRITFCIIYNCFRVAIPYIMDLNSGQQSRMPTQRKKQLRHILFNASTYGGKDQYRFQLNHSVNLQR